MGTDCDTKPSHSISEPASPTNNLEAALLYAALGWPVFPLHWPTEVGCSCEKAACTNVGKHPLTRHGFIDATTDKEQIKSWWEAWPSANIGMPTGKVSGFAVVDCDDEAAIRSFCLDRFADARHTRISRTGRGAQFFFQYEDGIRNDTGKKLGPKIDVRGEGGYVILPPSLHANGRHYEWLKENDSLPLPPALRKVLTTYSLDSAANNAQYSGTIFEGGRNTTLFSIGCYFRSKGLEPNIIEAALNTINAACEPPLPPQEIQAITKSVSRYPAGQKFAEYHPDHSSESLQAHPENFVLSDLIDLPTKEPDWIFEGLWQALTPGLFTGDGGLGKTHFTLQMLYALASAEEIQGTPIRCTKPRNVVYISQEDEADFLKDELLRQFPDLKNRPDVTNRIRIISTAIRGETLFLTNPFTYDYLVEHISEGAVFFLDSFSTFLTSNENDNNQILKGEIAALRRIIKARNATPLLLHHRPKPNQMGHKAASRDAIAIPQICRFHIMLEKAGSGVELSFEKVSRGLSPESVRLFFDEERRIFIPQETDKFIRVLKAAGRPLSTGELMETLGLDRKATLNGLSYRSRRGGPISKLADNDGKEAKWRISVAA